jgi:hypothetical protein
MIAGVFLFKEGPALLNDPKSLILQWVLENWDASTEKPALGIPNPLYSLVTRNSGEK